MKYIKHIIIFVLTVFFFFAAVAAINYFADPYEIFYQKKDKYMGADMPSCYFVNYDWAYIKMKRYKDVQKDILLMGGSDVYSAFCSPFNRLYDKYVNKIAMIYITPQIQSEMLEHYLEFHPETKKVLFFISYDFLIYSQSYVLPEFKKRYTLKEIRISLFSNDTLKKSREIIKNCKFDILKKRYAYPLYIDKNTSVKVYPNIITKFDDQNFPPHELRRILQTTIYHYEKMINLCESKNIEYEFIIDPCNAIFLYYAYQSVHVKENIEKFQKYLVSKNKKVYDFAFINRYTDRSLFDHNNLYFCHNSHMSYLYGIKIFKVLFDEKYAEKDIYIMLTKDKIDSILKYKADLINAWAMKNSDLVKRYEKIIRDNDLKLIESGYIYGYDIPPEEYSLEIDYVNNKLSSFQTEN